MKLVKLTDDHYVVVDETIQPVNGYYYDSFIKAIKDTSGAEYGEASHCWQITHSTRAMYKDEYISLQEVKELIGEVDMAEISYLKKLESSNQDKNWIGYGKGVDGVSKEKWKQIYNQAIEDNKEKKYTEEDMRKAMQMSKDIKYITYSEDDIIQSLQPKTEWEVQMVDGKLKLL